MVNPCFAALGEEKTLSLDEFISPSSEGLVSAVSSTSATQVMLWDGTSYALSFLYKPRGVTTPTWYDVATQAPSTMTLSPGTPVWVVQPSTVQTTDVALKGTVPNDATATHTIIPGMNMIGSAFTFSWDLNNCGVDWSTIAQAGASATSADRILVWDPAASTYKTYFFYKSRGTSELNYKWVDTSLHLAAPVPTGSGAWYERRGDSGFTFDEIRPY